MGRDNVMPVLGMVMVMVVFAGVNVLYKLSIEDGMSIRVLVAYRYVFATVFLGPLAFFVERKKRPRLTWLVIFQAFLCGLFGGSLAQNLYVASLSLTSASFASAMTNLIPAMTFILAVTFRLEFLAIWTVSGKAKVMGTLIGLGGAMLLTFYKGVEINPWKTSLDLLHHHDHHHRDVYNNIGNHRVSGNHALGSLLAVASCFSYAIWLIIQAKMIAKYTCLYSATALMCLMASVQGVVYALCMERNWGVWRLGFDIRLLTVLYTGVVASALTLTVMAWCIQKKGPLFASVFNPLMLVIVAVLGSVFLNEKLHLGSILGAVLIVIGLYVVLWGKCKETKQREQLLPVKTPMQQASEIELSEPPDSGTTTRISESNVTVDEAIFTAQVVPM